MGGTSLDYSHEHSKESTETSQAHTFTGAGLPQHTTHIQSRLVLPSVKAGTALCILRRFDLRIVVCDLGKVTVVVDQHLLCDDCLGVCYTEPEGLWPSALYQRPAACGIVVERS